MKLKLRYRALLMALAINLYGLGADLIAEPLHAHGRLQSPLGFVDGLGAILRFPGLAILAKTGGHFTYHLSTGERSIALAWNTLFWFIISGVALWAIGGHGARRHDDRAGDGEDPNPAASETTDPISPPDLPTQPAPTRRSFLTGGLRIAAAGVAATSAYSFAIEPRWIQSTHRVFRLNGLHKRLYGLRVVQLTDLHHGPNLSLNYIREIVRRSNALDPDLVLLTGDYVHRSSIYIRPVISELAGLRTKIGVVGVLGNHDWWQDGPMSKREFSRVGIPLIDNTRLFVTPDRKLTPAAQEGLCLAGVGDYMTDVQRYELALGAVEAEMPRLLLSHNPDVAEDGDFVASRLRVDLMLCGHTHGGQIWVPGFGTPVVPSRHGQKYAQGLVQGPVCPVFVSRGLGTTILPMRFCVPPEIAVIELTGAA
jgi:predicted MPP superfamily phosphohydrolase